MVMMMFLGDMIRGLVPSDFFLLLDPPLRGGLFGSGVRSILPIYLYV